MFWAKKKPVEPPPPPVKEEKKELRLVQLNETVKLRMYEVNLRLKNNKVITWYVCDSVENVGYNSCLEYNRVLYPAKNKIRKFSYDLKGSGFTIIDDCCTDGNSFESITIRVEDIDRLETALYDENIDTDETVEWHYEDKIV